MRYVLNHPSDTRPSLLVRTCDAIDTSEIERLRGDMFAAGCANGLLFDGEHCAILRDTFSSMARDSILVEADDLATTEVLASAGPGTLEERVERWLGMLSNNWNTALSEKPAVAAPFIADIVPAASGSFVQTSAESSR